MGGACTSFSQVVVFIVVVVFVVVVVIVVVVAFDVVVIAVLPQDPSWRGDCPDHREI